MHPRRFLSTSAVPFYLFSSTCSQSASHSLAINTLPGANAGSKRCKGHVRHKEPSWLRTDHRRGVGRSGRFHRAARGLFEICPALLAPPAASSQRVSHCVFPARRCVPWGRGSLLPWGEDSIGMKTSDWQLGRGGKSRQASNPSVQHFHGDRQTLLGVLGGTKITRLVQGFCLSVVG